MFEDNIKEIEIEKNDLLAVINATGQLFFKIEFYKGKKKVTYFNDSYKEIYGFSKEEFDYLQSSGELKNYFHPEDFEKIKNLAKKIRNSYKQVTLIYRFFNKKKNKYVWIEEIFKPCIKEDKTKIIYGTVRDITDIKKEEQKHKEKELENKKLLIASQKSYKDLFDKSPDLIYIQDLDLRFIDVNKAVLRKYGYKKSDIIGKTPEIFSAPGKNNLELFNKEISKVYKGKTIKILWWSITKDGKIFPKDLIVRKGKYFGKEVIIATGRDISKRFESEEKLKEKEENLSKILNTINEGIYSIKFTENNKKEFIYISPNIQKLLGYSPKELANISYKEKIKLYHPDDVKNIHYHTQLLIKNKQTIKTKYRFKPKGKKHYIWIEETVIPQFDQNQNIVQNFGVIRDITAEKVAEEFLKQNEERYRLLFSRNLAGVFRTKVSGEIVECNNAFAHIFGYKSRVELIGKNAHIFYHKKSDRKSYIEELKQKGFLKNYRLLHRKRDGSDLWILANISLIKDKLNNEEYIEGTLIDITEQVRTEKLLEQSKKNYKDLIENSPYGTIIHQNNIVIYANKRALEILKIDVNATDNFSKNNININDFLLPEFHKLSIERHQQAIKGQEIPFSEFKIKRADGVIIDIESKIIPFTFQNKQAFQIVFQDISHKKELEKEKIRLQIADETNKLLQKEIVERKKIQDSLAIQTAKLNAIIQSKSHLIWTINEDLILTLFNDNFVNYFKDNFKINIQKNKKLLSHFNEILDRESRTKFLQSLKNVFKGNKEYLEIELIDKYKEKRWIEIFVNPIKIKTNQKVKEISFIAQDITDKKRSEIKILQSIKEKEILLKEVHHRVKNNLQVISSILNLQSSYVKNDSILEVLKESQNRIKSMAFIHECLYQTNDFSSINFSKYISDLAKNLLHSYTFSNKKIDLILDIQNIKLDLDRSIPCGLILNELLSNALKYAFKNKKEGKIEVTLKQIKNTVKMTIKDDGDGLPENVDYKNTETLGLQLVMSLVQQLNAKISLKNKKGTTFTIQFNL